MDAGTNGTMMTTATTMATENNHSQLGSLHDEGFTDEGFSRGPVHNSTIYEVESEDDASGSGSDTIPTGLEETMPLDTRLRLSLDGMKGLPLPNISSVQECEELAYKLLASLPKSRLATLQRRLAPLLKFDVVGSLPSEVSLQIFSHLSFQTLLVCSLVSRRWKSLADDQTLWKEMCTHRGWHWKQPSTSWLRQGLYQEPNADDDEGMGDSDSDGDEHLRYDRSQLEDQDPFLEDSGIVHDGLQAVKAELTLMHAELDSGFASTSGSAWVGGSGKANVNADRKSVIPVGTALRNPRPVISEVQERVYPNFLSNGKGKATDDSFRSRNHRIRHSAPSVLDRPDPSSPSSFTSLPPHRPNYKLLYLTHIKLHNRFFNSSYRLSWLQTRGTSINGHNNVIYCLQLYTSPSTGVQTLFTGSRDTTIREWNLESGRVVRVINGVHTGSVLSLCVHNGYLASAGSDRRVGVWDLEKDEVVKVLEDHVDSVLGVRLSDDRLVSCSKDRTARTYSFPELEPQFVLGAHRSAVNAVAIHRDLIVSASGDRSIRLWDANTGKLVRTFENHHGRGIASIELAPPHILSGSSDKHLRLFDVTTLQGWSTSPDHYEGIHVFNHLHHLRQPQPQPQPSNSGIANTMSSTNMRNTPISSDALALLTGTAATGGSATKTGFGNKLQGSLTSPAGLITTPLICQGCGGTSLVPAVQNNTLGTSRRPREQRGGSVNGDVLEDEGQIAGPSTAARSSLSVPTSTDPVHPSSPSLSMGTGLPYGLVTHGDLVRSVALGEEFAISGSYDMSIKVWERKTGRLVGELMGGHTGRIFCVAFDRTKIVSCGEDQRICIWDFSHGIDTSFVQLS